MVQPPSAPAGQRVKLRGDYTRAAPDYTVEQRWDDYDALEHDTWHTLYLRQIELARRHAPPEFLAGLDLVGTTAGSIPRFADVNRTLGAATGWRIVAVPGVESPVPHRVAFDLVRVLRTDYLIDDFQRIYFVLDDFEQLFHAGYDTDFAPIYRRYAHTSGIAPGELLPTDHVIARGTQQRAGSAP